MPTKLVKRINLDLLYPPFLVKLLDVLAECEEAGGSYYATLGYRTFGEQMALYFQGRTTPGKKVTNARGGQSLHCYGAACDLVFDVDGVKDGLQPSWGERDYGLLEKVGTAHGLQVGVPGLADFGHAQLPLAKKLGRKEVGIVLELKNAHDAGGLPAAWKKLDGWGPW